MLFLREIKNLSTELRTLRRHKKIKGGRVLLVASMVLFALSLGFECFYCVGESPNWSFAPQSGAGLLVLLIGWMGILAGEVAWLANPCYAIAMIIAMISFEARSKSKKTKREAEADALHCLIAALVFSLAGVVLAFSFLLQSTTYFGPGPGGTTHQIAGYSPGYFLWVASLVTQLLGLVMEIKRGRQEMTAAESVPA